MNTTTSTAPGGTLPSMPVGRGSFVSRLSAFDWVYALLIVAGAGYAFKRYGASMDVYELSILAGAVPSLIAIGWFWGSLRPCSSPPAPPVP